LREAPPVEIIHVSLRTGAHETSGHNRSAIESSLVIELFAMDQPAGPIELPANPIKTESTIQHIETEKFGYVLSLGLGFFQISVVFLEKVTFPGQKMLNMG
jgi:hypothetical protein